ncbi:hypothetical protein BS50DRAFT_656366 [Corynespora cassiicola Philippines]|uniref:NAD(P)-binding protein n=1 Tax=Corynespora cassiicola Philippines TaxID=1448308 RepID=A0A2T2N405_CORCC|nr:hypothetical protein BS50DRAFT_656366 [Corynespora cassiicola Philippines]
MLRGKLLITGSSKKGIGAKVAVCLASASAKLLILAGRNKNRVNPVVEEIQQANTSVQVEFVALDLLSNASVRVMATRQSITSVEGVESQFASNYLGHF